MYFVTMTLRKQERRAAAAANVLSRGQFKYRKWRNTITRETRPVTIAIPAAMSAIAA
jgi:hypothetical protein